MRVLLRALYSAAANLASVATKVIPPGESKTAIAFRARRGIARRYRAWADAHRLPQRPLLWMHAPSVGEGLQARPVLTLIRKRRPDVQLAYTFFSPSAEEFSRSLDVDFKDYLPFDAAADTAAALDALRPSVLVFSKLDLWPELVRQAKRRGVRLGMISATLGPLSGRRSRAAALVLGDAYGLLDAVGAVDDEDAARLVDLGVRREVIRVTGDTRFDQVWDRAHAVDRASRLQTQLATGRPTVVAGSTWPADELPLLEGFLRARRTVPDLRLVIAPHELSRNHLTSIESWATRNGLDLARLDAADGGNDVVLVDRFGALGDLYALATVAFVGGGFHDAGLHSVLEPAAYGAPVFFGPQHERSRDAFTLLAENAARPVHDAADVERVLLEWTQDHARRAEIGGHARAAVEHRRGAAERSVALVLELLG